MSEEEQEAGGAGRILSSCVWRRTTLELLGPNWEFVVQSRSPDFSGCAPGR